MSNDVRCTNRKRTVQHPQQEYESIARVSCAVLPVLPDRISACIRLVIDMRHDGADQDGNEDSRDYCEASNYLNLRERAIHVQDDAASDPGDDDVDHEDMPALCDKVGMHHGVHGCELRGHNLKC